MTMLGEYYYSLEIGEEPSPTLEEIMHWHLTYNHYPAADPTWIPICLEVVDKLRNQDGKWDDTIEIPRPYYIPESQWKPENFTYEAVVEAFHLDHFFIDYSEPMEIIQMADLETEEGESDNEQPRQ